ncbi:hypothetical protein PI124_g12511 [Phytophthora idaei]|nr:hypothetical protein PI124_g12511 [Phytophthora idaei]
MAVATRRRDPGAVSATNATGAILRDSEAGGDVGRKAHQVARTSCAEGSGARGSEADVEVPIEEFAGDGF